MHYYPRYYIEVVSGQLLASSAFNPGGKTRFKYCLSLISVTLIFILCSLRVTKTTSAVLMEFSSLNTSKVLHQRSRWVLFVHKFCYY